MLVKTIPLDEDNPKVILTTYILDDSQELLDGGKRPAVVVCPGGAYLSCSDREGEPVALRFAAMGYHAFVLRYNVFFEEGNEFERLVCGESFEARERSQYPSAIHDLAKAMTTIYDKAEEWLVDTDKIAICGFSAGGHNVLNYAVHYDKPIITDFFATEKVKPAAVIAGYPISDYIYLRESVKRQDAMAQGLFNLSNLAFFGEETPSDEKLFEISANRQVSTSTPPMFIWATAGDALVSAGHSTRMATALADAGVPFELHIYEDGGHGLSLANQATAKSFSEVNLIASEWIDSADKWLQKRFALPLNEKSDWS